MNQILTHCIGHPLIAQPVPGAFAFSIQNLNLRSFFGNALDLTSCMLDGVMHWNVASWRIAAAAKLAVLERNGMSNLHVDAATRPLAAAWPLLAANAVCECARLETELSLVLWIGWECWLWSNPRVEAFS